MLGAKRPSGETRATKDFLNIAAPRVKTARMVNIQLANHAFPVTIPLSANRLHA